MSIHIGTSGWAYATWKPDFYPAKLPAKKFLEYYATQLNSVEVNYTFRSFPTEAMLAGWLAAVGPNFTFSFKANQRITHFARLKNCAELTMAFYSALAPIFKANQLGVVLFQLPPNFKADAGLLDEFLSIGPSTGVRRAFEFRHTSWFTEETFGVLRRHEAAICVAESDEFESPDVVTAPFRCYRLRKSDYSPPEVETIITDMRSKASEGHVFVYFKHEETPAGALNAATVLRRLRAG
jgi:uncharacterized protein YecE (DUF72 family)